MKKLAKAVTAVLAVGALGTLVFMRMTKKEEPMEAVPDPSVQVENPAADTISISTDLTGTVEPADVVYGGGHGKRRGPGGLCKPGRDGGKGPDAF